jgi:hypothetical protein
LGQGQFVQLQCAGIVGHADFGAKPAAS